MDPMLNDNERELLLRYQEKKEKLRQEAVAKELNRLNTKINKKNRIITLQRVVATFLLAGLCFLIYHSIAKEQSSAEVQTTTVTTIAKTTEREVEKPLPIQPIVKNTEYYQVHFRNLPRYPLAQFSNKETAENFQNKIAKLYFPATSISIVAIPTELPNKDSTIYKPRYSVQIGAYNHALLQEYHDRFIWLKHCQENGMHKYRIAPFSGFSRSKTFAQQLEGNDYYIVRE